jgi:hypothetical protein
MRLRWTAADLEKYRRLPVRRRTQNRRVHQGEEISFVLEGT